MTVHVLGGDVALKRTAHMLARHLSGIATETAR